MFPTLDSLPKDYTVSPEDRKGLRNLERILYDLVNSIEFEDLVIANGWNSEWGHCAVASEAMQILAWKLLGVYLVTMNVKDGEVSHWFLKEPNSDIIYDPTSYQFGTSDLHDLYNRAVARGLQSRTREEPYTRRESVETLVEIIGESLS